MSAELTSQCVIHINRSKNINKIEVYCQQFRTSEIPDLKVIRPCHNPNCLIRTQLSTIKLFGRCWKVKTIFSRNCKFVAKLMPLQLCHFGLTSKKWDIKIREHSGIIVWHFPCVNLQNFLFDDPKWTALLSYYVFIAHFLNGLNILQSKLFVIPYKLIPFIKDQFYS